MHTKNDRILILLTNVHESSNKKKKTGFDVRELAIMIQELKSKWNQRTKSPKEFMDMLTFASARGGPAPIDPKSVEQGQQEPSVKEFLGDYDVINRIRNTEPIENLNPEDYLAILIPGGHGAMFDLAECNETADFLEDAYFESNAILCSVCHGAAAFIGMKHPENDEWAFLRDKNVTCISNEEEKNMDWVEEIPFMLEDKLKELGAKLSFAPKPHQPHVVVDERLVTGQNTESSKLVIERLTEMIESFKK